MDAVVSVLNRLGMDASVFIQFAIFCALYFLMVPLFIKKLQLVLEEREANTTGLKEHAQKELDKANTLEEDYQQKFNSSMEELQKKFHADRHELMLSEKMKLRQLEDQLDDEIDSKKEKFIVELEEQKKQLLGQTSQLSSHLIEKLAGRNQ